MPTEENYTGKNVIETLTIGSEHDRIWWSPENATQYGVTHLFAGVSQDFDVKIYCAGDDPDNPGAVAITFVSHRGTATFTSAPAVIGGVLDGSLPKGLPGLLAAINLDTEHNMANEYGPDAQAFRDRLEELTRNALQP